jgi:ElaB/YqjD/DUF883 family membrane-anchored ribosome-binding protein
MPHASDHENVVGSSPMAKQTTEITHELRDTALRQADAGMDRAAEGAHRVAQTLRERAGHFEGVGADAGERVAETFDRGADYLREHDTEQFLGDVKSYVRKHPMQAVAGAIVGGLLLGKFFL